MSLMDTLEYRWNIFMRVFRYTLGIWLIALVWIGINTASPLAEINEIEIIRYYFLTALLYSAYNFHTDYIEEDIRLGYISRFLVKPVSAFWFYFIHQATIAFFETFLKVIVMLPILLYFVKDVPWSPVHVLLFVLLFPFVFLMMFSMYFGLSTLAFWFQTVESLRMSVMFVFRFLSGTFIPLALMPQMFLTISRYLPFGYVAFFPVQLIEGKMNDKEIFIFFLVLGGWTLLFHLFQHFIWEKAVHSYESTGI